MLGNQEKRPSQMPPPPDTGGEDAEFQKQVRAITGRNFPGISPTARSLWSKVLFFTMQLSGAIHQPHGPDSGRQVDRVVDVRNDETVHRESLRQRERENFLPQVRGFEYIGLPSERVEAFLAQLPPHLVRDSNVRQIQFLPKQIPDLVGPRYFQRTPSAARETRATSHRDMVKYRSMTRAEHQDNAFTATPDDPRTSGITIGLFRITETDDIGDLAHPDQTVPDPTREHPNQRRTLAVRPAFETLTHELMHGMGTAGQAEFEQIVRSSNCLDIPYARDFVDEASDRSHVNWERMADEYRSELAKEMLTRVRLQPGESYEDAAVRHLMERFSFDQPERASSVRDQVRLMMSILENGHRIDWSRMVEGIQGTIDSAEQDFFLHRYQLIYGSGLTDPALRGVVNGILSVPKDQIPEMREMLSQDRAPVRDVEELHHLQGGLIQKVRDRMHNVSQRDDIFDAWREAIQVAAYLNEEIRYGRVHQLAEMSGEGLSRFGQLWNTLQPAERDALRPSLVQVARVINGEFALPAWAVRTSHHEHHGHHPHDAQRTSHHGHRSHHRDQSV